MSIVIVRLLGRSLRMGCAGNGLGYSSRAVKRRNPLDSSHLMSNQSIFEQHRAIIIDYGSDAYEWVRAQFENGEECFLYGDAEGTVRPKELPIGTWLNCQHPRECINPGRTKWATTCLAFKLQSHDFQALYDPGLAVQTSSLEPIKNKIYKRQLTARFSVLREKKIDQIIEFHGMSGKYATADAVAHCIDLCIEHNLI